MTPARDAGLSARERTYRYLRQAIVSGELGSGLRLVEERIAEELDVSRTPVREALQRLSAEGLIVRLRRGHLEVAPLGGEHRAELHMLRVAIDEVVARLLARKAATVPWDELYALLEPLEATYRTSGIRSPAYAMAHIDLHVAINTMAFSGPTGLVAGGASMYPTDDYVQQEGYEPVSQHRELLDALAGGDEVTAVSAALAHARRGPADDPEDVAVHREGVANGLSDGR